MASDMITNSNTKRIQPAIIIGLGGTGVKTITYLKKTLLEQAVDYMQFGVSNTRPSLKIFSGDGHFEILSDYATETGFLFYDDATHFGEMTWNRSGGDYLKIASTSSFYLLTSRDWSDYLEFRTTSNIPEITKTVNGKTRCHRTSRILVKSGALYSKGSWAPHIGK